MACPSISNSRHHRLRTCNVFACLEHAWCACGSQLQQLPVGVCSCNCLLPKQTSCSGGCNTTASTHTRTATEKHKTRPSQHCVKASTLLVVYCVSCFSGCSSTASAYNLTATAKVLHKRPLQYCVRSDTSVFCLGVSAAAVAATTPSMNCSLQC